MTIIEYIYSHEIWSLERSSCFALGQSIALSSLITMAITHLKAWNEHELAPIIKYIPIDFMPEVNNRKQYFFIKSINDISTIFCLPVVTINAKYAYQCIAVRSYSFSFSFKATFIHRKN